MSKRKKHRAPVFVLASGSFALLLAGCSGNSSSSSPASPTPDFTGASTSTAADVSASVGSLTIAQASSSAGALIAPRSSVSSRPELVGGGHGCGTVVVNATGQNGQITDETITFALPACEFTGVQGQDSLALTGTLELTMPDATGFNFTAKPTALDYALTDAGVVSSETRTGTWQVSATSSSASQFSNMTTQFVKAGASTGTLVDGLTLSFSPVSGSSLAKGQPLPDGTLQASGTVSWTPSAPGSSADSFTVTTITPLAYDASCAGTSASPFDSGQLRVVIADGSVKTYGQITWTNCGAPVVVVI